MTAMWFLQELPSHCAYMPEVLLSVEATLYLSHMQHLPIMMIVMILESCGYWEIIECECSV
jgi:hypothetical protein